MIFYLTTEEINSRRVIGQHTHTDSIAAQLYELGIRTRIVTKSSLLKMVDDGVMPVSDNDIVFVRSLDRDTLSYLKPLYNREFKVINSHKTLSVIRDLHATLTTLNSAGIPVRMPVNDQIFSKNNFDRTRGFGQGFEDFIIEFIKDYNLQSFNLVSAFRTPRYGYFDSTKLTGGYTISDSKNFNWGEVNLQHSYYILNGLPSGTIRIPVIDRMPVVEAALFTEGHFIDNLKIDQNFNVINFPDIESHCHDTILTLNLECGYIDFHIIDGELKVFNISNLDQDYKNPYKLDQMLVEYLAKNHGY